MHYIHPHPSHSGQVREYVQDAAGRGLWPLCCNILDPVRASVVCSGPDEILEVEALERQEGRQAARVERRGGEGA